MADVMGQQRVSTADQNPDLQLHALKKADCKTIYNNKVSGTVYKHTYLERCLKALQGGAVLVVWKLDRLDRSLRDLIALLDDLKERGIAFRSNKSMNLQKPCKWTAFGEGIAVSSRARTMPA
jgi:DNA invertase Pin-like site-specific DNA recombinase